MNISGIRPTIGFYDYNEIKKTEAVAAESVAASQPAGQVAENQPEKSPVQGRTPETEAKQTFGAYDYAAQYNPKATYSLKGAESDIHSLDVEKAVSDMQKDEVIHQYQYFVGQEMSANANATVNVRGGEDFSL